MKPIFHTRTFFSAVLGILLIGLIVSPISNTTAWSNSSYADDPEAYDTSTDFGTHDWLALAALKALAADNPSGWSWLEDREKIFLTGTEAPDNGGLTITLDGKEVEGFGDTTMHHIYFNQDGTIANNEDDAGIRAKTVGDLANSYYSEEKFDLAAFYLGAMTHYIADMAMYAHTTPNNVDPYYLDFDEHHSEVEGYTNTRTNNYEEVEEFFKIETVTIKNIAPYDAAKELAWDTYKDPDPSISTTRDAVWLHNNFFTSWKQTYATRADDTTSHQQYYNRVEESLNLAIEYIAAAMNNRISPEEEVKEEEGIAGFPIYLILSISVISLILLRRQK